MKAQKALFSVIAALAGLVVAANVLFFVYDNFFYSINQLPQGEHVVSATSHSGRYVVEMYKVQNSMGVAVRGELFDNITKTVKNVYWENHTDKIEIFWLNETMVSINGNVVDIMVDRFDSRRPIIDDIEDALAVTRRK